MKKCYVLREMKVVANEAHFQDARIKPRKTCVSIPFFGTINGQITQYEFPFKAAQE
jgi:hypothetical protein